MTNHKKSGFIQGLVAATVIAIPMSGAAYAASDQGFYLSVDGGISNSSVQRFSRDLSQTECDVSNATVNQCDYSTSNRRLAANAGIGYQIGEYFAFELNYYDLVDDKSSLDMSASATIGGEYVTLDNEQTLDLRLRGVGVRAVATIPVSERWSALLNFGLGRFKHQRSEWAELQWRGSSQPEPEITVYQEESQVVPFAGAGLQYQLSERFDLRAMVNSYAVSGESGASTPFNGRSLTTATLGVVYRF